MKITIIQPKKSTQWSMKPSSLVKSAKPLNKRFWNNLRLSTASNSTIQVLLTAEFPLTVTEYCYNPNVYSAIKRSRIPRKDFSYDVNFQLIKIFKIRGRYFGLLGLCWNLRKFLIENSKKKLKSVFITSLEDTFSWHDSNSYRINLMI